MRLTKSELSTLKISGICVRCSNTGEVETYPGAIYECPCKEKIDMGGSTSWVDIKMSGSIAFQNSENETGTILNTTIGDGLFDIKEALKKLNSGKGK